MIDEVNLSDKQKIEDSVSVVMINEYWNDFTDLCKVSSEQHNNHMTVVILDKRKDWESNVTCRDYAKNLKYIPRVGKGRPLTWKRRRDELEPPLGMVVRFFTKMTLESKRKHSFDRLMDKNWTNDQSPSIIDDWMHGLKS